MSDFTLFVCGIIVTLIAGMGIITCQVFLGYHKFVIIDPEEEEKEVLDY